MKPSKRAGVTMLIVITSAIMLWTWNSLSSEVDPQLRYELLLRHLILLALISFPIGILGLALIWMFTKQLSHVFPEGALGEAFLIWIVCSSAAYAQWFKIVPGVISRWRRRLNTRVTPKVRTPHTPGRNKDM